MLIDGVDGAYMLFVVQPAAVPWPWPRNSFGTGSAPVRPAVTFGRSHEPRSDRVQSPNDFRAVRMFATVGRTVVGQPVSNGGQRSRHLTAAAAIRRTETTRNADTKTREKPPPEN